MEEDGIPVLPAYYRANEYHIWCEYCFHWHDHEPREGHYLARCYDPASPYELAGYKLKYAGMLTNTIENQHGVPPADLEPLTEQQYRLWQIVYGTRFCTASRLLNLFVRNHQDGNICGDHQLARVTSLRWKIQKTPGVRVRKQKRPWTYAIPTPVESRNAHEELKIVLPDDAQPGATWAKKHLASCAGEMLPVSQAWASFRRWQRGKGEDYRITREDWLRELKALGINPQEVKGGAGDVFVEYMLT